MASVHFQHSRSEHVDLLIRHLETDEPAPNEWKRKTIRFWSSNSGLTGYKLSEKNSFDTWHQQNKKKKKKRPEDITKHKYSVKGGKKLSVMGRLWKTFWRTFFRGMIPIVSLFFSTVNPYLIAGRTKRSEGSRVITSFSWTWPRETSRDKLLCRRLCFFALEDVCCFCCCGICCFCRWRIISL